VPLPTTLPCSPAGTPMPSGLEFAEFGGTGIRATCFPWTELCMYTLVPSLMTHVSIVIPPGAPGFAAPGAPGFPAPCGGAAAVPLNSSRIFFPLSIHVIVWVPLAIGLETWYVTRPLGPPSFPAGGVPAAQDGPAATQRVPGPSRAIPAAIPNLATGHTR